MLKNKIKDTFEVTELFGKSWIKENEQLQTESQFIQITKYPEYFDAIIKDDVNAVENILQKADIGEKYMLVNSAFDFEDEAFKDLYAKTTRAMLPFHLAVCFSSPNVAKALIKHKVDPLTIDPDGKNLLHACVVAAFYNRELEEKIASMVKWLETNLSKENLQFLLHHENFDGLRPIEFAAQQGALLVMKAILETSGYVTSQYQRGLAVYSLHDITEYETGTRNSVSPINMLAQLDVERLNDPNTTKCLLDPLILSWIDGKLKSNIIPLLGWVAVRVLILIFFMLLDVDASLLFKLHGHNYTVNHYCPGLIKLNTHLSFSITISFAIITLCSLIIIADIAECIIVHYKKLNFKCYNLNGKKIPVANKRFFFIVQCIITMTIVICVAYYVYILITLDPFIPWLYTFILLGKVLLPIFILWSLLYFLQLVPIIGPKIISLQTMISSMGSFLIIFFLNNLLFVHIYQTFVNMHSLTGCVDDFSDFYNTVYTTFQLMLNLYDTTSVSVSEKVVYEILHMVYVIMVGYMLVNFLVAVMTDSALRVSQNEDIILKINQLSIVVTLEERIYWLLRNVLYRRMRKFGFYCSEGRCYLRSKVDRKTELLN